jgi:hypothetical protein
MIEDAWFIVVCILLFLCVVLFAGSPDIHDGLIKTANKCEAPRENPVEAPVEARR